MVCLHDENTLLRCVVGNVIESVLDITEGISHHVLLAHEFQQLLFVVNAIDSLYHRILDLFKLLITHLSEVPHTK